MQHIPLCKDATRGNNTSPHSRFVIISAFDRYSVGVGMLSFRPQYLTYTADGFFEIITSFSFQDVIIRREWNALCLSCSNLRCWDADGEVPEPDGYSQDQESPRAAWCADVVSWFPLYVDITGKLTVTDV